jgi:hypothetical protein
MTSYKIAKCHVHLLLKHIIGFFFVSTSASSYRKMWNTMWQSRESVQTSSSTIHCCDVVSDSLFWGGAREGVWMHKVTWGNWVRFALPHVASHVWKLYNLAATICHEGGKVVAFFFFLVGASIALPLSCENWVFHLELLHIIVGILSIMGTCKIHFFQLLFSISYCCACFVGLRFQCSYRNCYRIQIHAFLHGKQMDHYNL